jgi:16S rRNA (guanine966-N2)-methyltransferase
MSIKIIGGVAKGFSLATPYSVETRPTSIMIRRKLFDWRQSMEGFSFIDVFAGSGSMGFEALSRGAEKVCLNDSARGAFLTLKQNKEKMVNSFKFDPANIHLSNSDALRWLGKDLFFEFPDTTDCVVYLDPPYEKHSIYPECLQILKEKGFDGEIWVESDKLKGLKEDALTGLFHSVTKVVGQGDHFVLVGKIK